MEKGQAHFTPNYSTADAAAPESMPGRKAGNDLVDTMRVMGKGLVDLAKIQEGNLRKIVDSIVAGRFMDNMEIERTLDYLLDIMDWGAGEKDFNRLLGYYKTIDKNGYEFYRNEAEERRKGE